MNEEMQEPYCYVYKENGEDFFAPPTGYVPDDATPLYTSPPAQQEPVATDWERIARVQDAKLRAMCNESGGFEKLCEVMDRYEHTSPQPAQQEPVAWKHDCAALLTNDVELWIDQCPHCGKPRTSPQPAQRTWQGRTEEEIKEIVGPWGDTPIKGYTRKLFDQIEAKLKEKNT